MSYFGFSEDFEDLYPKPSSQNPSKSRKVKVSMGGVSEAEKKFIEELAAEHSYAFEAVFIKSVAGYHFTLHADDYCWVLWIKFLLNDRTAKINKLKASYRASITPINILPNLAPISEEDCFEGIILDFPKSRISDVTSHIRLKIYTDPDQPA